MIPLNVQMKTIFNIKLPSRFTRQVLESRIYIHIKNPCPFLRQLLVTLVHRINPLDLTIPSLLRTPMNRDQQNLDRRIIIHNLVQPLFRPLKNALRFLFALDVIASAVPDNQSRATRRHDLIKKHQLVGCLRPPERSVSHGKRSQIAHGIRPSLESATSNQKNPARFGIRKGPELFHLTREFARNRGRTPFRCSPTRQAEK